MKLIVTLIFSVVLNTLNAQVYFEEVLSLLPATYMLEFEDVQDGSVAFSDVDGDTDQDVLVTGESPSGQRISKLYTNNGLGNFTEIMGTSFDGVMFSSIAFSDVDGDTDQDVLITGRNNGNQYIAKLYTNNGFGIFTEVIGTPFDGVRYSSIAFSDVDGDTDQDVLITGSNSSYTAKLYTNNGVGNFTEVIGTPFDGIEKGSIAFSDVDGDTDQDILITGFNNLFQRIAKLYTNNGLGNYTEMVGTPFDGVTSGSIAFFDLDGDTDQDILITGYKNLTEYIAKLYNNDGSGNFTEVMGTPFDGVMLGSIAFSDVDGDMDQDILITGYNNLSEYTAKLYNNDGSGNFTEVIGTPFDGVRYSSIAFSDVDDDTDQDVLITGVNNLGEEIAKLYTNNGSGNFTEESGTPFDGVEYSSIAFTDIDGDNDQDVLITGNNGSQNIAKLYKNVDCFSNTGDTTAISCGSFEWYGTNYTTSGTPTHTLTNYTGCDSVVTLNLTINTVDNTVTQTNGVNLMANAIGANYQWIDCENSYLPIVGETSQTFLATENVDYAVIVTENGCSDTSDCVTVDNVGIAEGENILGVSIYPNPATEKIHITLREISNQGYQLTIFNSIGSEVLRQNLNTKTTTVTTSKLNAGVYFVRITNLNHTTLKKLVIE